MEGARAVVWTVGHSNGPPEAMLEPLRAVGVELLVDVRTVPKSRRVPWAHVDQLPAVLARAGIGYVHLPELGGLRKARADSPNAAWNNMSFRGYADHMGSEEFARGLEHLLALARTQRVVVMCAEAVPWRCHRSLVADALVARGVEVRHLFGGKSQAHRLTPFARVEGTAVTYPLAGGRQARLDEAADLASSHEAP